MQLLGREGDLPGRLLAVCQSTSPLSGRYHSRDAEVDAKLGCWNLCTFFLVLISDRAHALSQGQTEQTEQTEQTPMNIALSLIKPSSKKFSAAAYKFFDPLELFFFPHLSVGKVNSLLWKLHFGGLLRVILVARQKWVFLRSRLP